MLNIFKMAAKKQPPKKSGFIALRLTRNQVFNFTGAKPQKTEVMAAAWAVEQGARFPDESIIVVPVYHHTKKEK